MKFLLDANVGSTIARALWQAGHDVVRAAIETPRHSDETILARAVRENRVLVTYDRDFSKLIYFHKASQPPAIIYIRYAPDDIDDVVLRLMAVLDFTFLRDHMTVIDAQRTRRRSLPIKSIDHG